MFCFPWPAQRWQKPDTNWGILTCLTFFLWNHLIFFFQLSYIFTVWSCCWDRVVFCESLASSWWSKFLNQYYCGAKYGKIPVIKGYAMLGAASGPLVRSYRAGTGRESKRCSSASSSPSGCRNSWRSWLFLPMQHNNICWRIWQAPWQLPYVGLSQY